MIEAFLSPSSDQREKWQEGSAVIRHLKGLTKYNTEEAISKIEKNTNFILTVAKVSRKIIKYESTYQRHQKEK